MFEILLPTGLASIAMLWTSLRVLREYERAVVFRLGRLKGAKGPGLVFLVPFGVDRMVKVPLRIVALDIPPQDVITRDRSGPWSRSRTISSPPASSHRPRCGA